MQTANKRLDALNRRLDNVELALRRHRSHDDTMTSGGQALLESAEELLHRSRDALSQRWERASRLPEPRSEEMKRIICDDFSAALRELSSSLLPALDGAVTNRVPVELEPVLQRLAESAAPSWTCHVLLYAADAFNYSIELHEDPLVSLLPTLSVSQVISPRREVFVFLRIPEIDRDSATLHTIVIGHELGHLKDWANRLSASIPLPEPPAWCDSAGQLMLEHVDDYQLFSVVCRSWLRELVADIAAAITFGPAALNALSELIGNLGHWTLDSSTHPAADRRTAVALEVLRRLNYFDVVPLRPVLSHFEAETVDALTRSATAVDLPSRQEVVNFARDLVFNQVDALITTCMTQFSPTALESTRWSEVQEGAELLASGVPFGETIGADSSAACVDDAVLLNAGWLARIELLDRLGSVVGLDASVSRQASQISAVLDGLILKSFEIAESRR